jgi:16S rRNA (guanine527-N7)-methyltransferase
MLIDSVNKKIEAIRQMTADIGVEVELMHTRAEEMARITDKGSVYRQAFDCVVARAVAPLNILAEYCLPLVKLNGWFIARKGATSENEISEATEAVKKTGGVLKRTIDILLPTGIQRTLLIFEKISNTSREYPRATKIIKSRPL